MHIGLGQDRIWELEELPELQLPDKRREFSVHWKYRNAYVLDPSQEVLLVAVQTLHTAIHYAVRICLDWLEQRLNVQHLCGY